MHRMGLPGLGSRRSALRWRLADRWPDLTPRVRPGLSRRQIDAGADAGGGARTDHVVRVELLHGRGGASRAGWPRGNCHPCHWPVARAATETRHWLCGDQPVGQRPRLRCRDLDCPASEVRRSRWSRAEGRRRRRVLPRRSLRRRAGACQRVRSKGAGPSQDRIPRGARGEVCCDLAPGTLSSYTVTASPGRRWRRIVCEFARRALSRAAGRSCRHACQ